MLTTLVLALAVLLLRAIRLLLEKVRALAARGRTARQPA